MNKYLIFYITWIVTTILGAIWSVLMHIDLPKREMLSILTTSGLIKSVLIGYLIATIITLFLCFANKRQGDQDKKDKEKQQPAS